MTGWAETSTLGAFLVTWGDVALAAALIVGTVLAAWRTRRRWSCGWRALVAARPPAGDVAPSPTGTGGPPPDLPADFPRGALLNDLDQRFEETLGHAIATLSAAAVRLERRVPEAVPAATPLARKRALASLTQAHGLPAKVQGVTAATQHLCQAMAALGRRPGDAGTIAQAGARQVEEAGEAVVGLLETIQEIGELIDLIGEVAQQTSLLALTATLETAMGAEATGRNLAAAAADLRGVAARATVSTGKIGAKVDKVESVAVRATVLIERVDRAVHRIDRIVAALAEMAEQDDGAPKSPPESPPESPAAAVPEPIAPAGSGGGLRGAVSRLLARVRRPGKTAADRAAEGG